MNMMETFIKKYKKLLTRKKILTIGWFALMALALLGGLTGIIIGGARNNDSIFTLSIQLGLILPVAMWVAYLIFLVASKDKKRKALDLELENSALSAEEILQLGTALKIDLFGVALNKRVKELGLAYVPEWCVRDDVLPTKEDVEKQK